MPGSRLRGMAVAAPTNADLRAEDAITLGGISARKALLLVGAAVLLLGSLVLIAPSFADLADTWRRLESGELGWLALALVFAVLSFAGHVVLFSAVAGRGGGQGGGIRGRPQKHPPPNT